ncbi:MAG TPA: T9SS type A sorting domain-containing protein [Candidatus Acidoferrales bacterium]|nr:T9SS type A sorting domain-containing protein [Candidatus Acidoferrales bacterium]
MKISSTLLFVALLTMSAQAQKLWTGSGGDGLWTTATNWSGGTVPTSADSVVLDNTNIAGSYTVTIPLAGTAVVKELQIGYPGNTNIITLYFASNAATAGFKFGDGAAGNLDFDIDQGGVFINASNAASGSTYFQRVNTGDSLRVKSGGKFVQVTTLSFSTPFPAATTKFDEGSTFELNVRGTGLATPTVSGRTYGNYTLAADSAGGTRTYQSTSGGGAFKVLDTWTIESGVTLLPWGGTGVDSINNISNSGVMSFAPASGSLYIYGSLTVNDSFIVSSATLPCTFSGSSYQLISGTGLIEFKDSVIIANSGSIVALGGNVVDSGSVTVTGNLSAGMSSITGSGSFRLYPNATLFLGGANGVNDLVKPTGIISLSKSANYYFNGGGPQYTGTLMPDTVRELRTYTSTGVTLSRTTVANFVTMTGVGNITTTGDTLIAPNGVSGSYGGGAYIDGNLSYNVTATGAWIFPVGSGLISYLPVEIDFSTLTGSGAVVVGAVDSTVTAPTLSLGDTIKMLRHYFVIGNAAGITAFTDSLILTYTASDLARLGITKDSSLHVYQSSGPHWIDLPITARDVTNKTIKTSKVSSFGTFILGVPVFGPKEVTIAQAKKDDNHDFVPDYSVTGDTLIVYGVVTSPNVGSTYTSYYIQDSTAGIDVYKGGTIMPFSIGDSVFVIGKILQNKGVEEISPLAADSVHFGILKHNATVPQPKLLTLHGYVSNSEDVEGSLIEIDSLYKVSGTWAGNQNIYVTNAAHTDTTILYINQNTNVGSHAEPMYPINLVGIASQFTSSVPPNNGYEIIPRDTNDVKSVATIPPAAPTILLPANGSAYQRADTLDFKWNSSPTATKYLFQLSTNRLFSSFVVADSNVADTTRRVTALANSTKYFWRVGAYNVGGFGPFSVVDSFTTIIAIPAVPTIVSPNGSTGEPRRTTFKWNSTANATSYHLQVGTDNSFSSVVRDVTTPDTSLQISDTLTASTTYYWHVSAIDTGGASAYTAATSFKTGTGVLAVDGRSGTPKEFALYQNYPNPFNPSTMINYDLPKNSYVKVTIYDLLGRVVADLVDGMQNADRYSIEWNPSGLSSGIYFCRIQAQSQDGTAKFTSVKKLLYMK